MKNLSLIVLGILLIIFDCDAQDKINSFPRNNLFGKVKYIKVFQFKVIEKEGQFTKGDNMDSEGYHYLAKYDEKGNKTESILSGVGFPVNSKFTYDDNGQILLVKYYGMCKDSCFFHAKESYKYDAKGKEIEYYMYSSDSSLLSSKISKYDDNGKIIQTISFSSIDSLKTKRIYKYSNNNIVEEQYYKSDSLSISGIIYKYDRKGNMTEERHFSQGKIQHIYNYEEGKKTEENIYNPDGSLYNRITYKYDDKNLMIEMSISNPKKNSISKFTYIHEFDKQGNWIKRMEYHNGKPFIITERLIEYYD